MNVTGDDTVSVRVKEYPNYTCVRLVVKRSRNLNVVFESDVDFSLYREYEPEHSDDTVPNLSASENGRKVMSWKAKEGNYLIFIFAAQEHTTGSLTMRVMSDIKYDAYLQEQKAQQPDEPTAEDTTENEPDSKEQPTEQPTEEAAEQPTEQPTEEATEQPTEQPTEEAAEQPTEQPTEEAAEQPTEQTTEEATEQPTEQPTEEATEQPTEQTTEEPAEQPTEQTTEEPTEQPTAQDEQTEEENAPAKEDEQPAAQDEEKKADENDEDQEDNKEEKKQEENTQEPAEQPEPEDKPQQQDAALASLDTASIKLDLTEYLAEDQSDISLAVLMEQAYNSLTGKETYPGLSALRNETTEEEPYALSAEFLEAAEKLVTGENVKLEGTTVELLDSFESASILLKTEQGVLSISLLNYAKPAEEAPAAEPEGEEASAIDTYIKEETDIKNKPEQQEPTAEEPAAEKAEAPAVYTYTFDGLNSQATLKDILDFNGIALETKAKASISDSHLVTIAALEETIQDGLANNYLLTAIDYFEEDAVLSLLGEKRIDVILFNPAPAEEPKEAPKEEPAEAPAEKPAEEPAVDLDHLAVSFTITWDDKEPGFGSLAHFDAVLNGFEGLDYSIQWQYSVDGAEWADVENAVNNRMNMVITEANYLYYWRVMVYVNIPAES